MTQISDNLHLGPAATNIASISAGGRGFGPAGRCYIVDMVPLTLNASAYAASQSPGANALTLSAGTGIVAIADAYGIIRYTADVPRAVTITSGGNDAGIAFLIKGYDEYNFPMSQLLTGTNGSTATTLKAFKSVISIVPNGAVASTATAGTADVFGLPVSIIDVGYLANAGWNNTQSDNSGTLTVADQTSPATTTTGDVRGTFAQSGAASNGIRRLVLTLALSNLNAGTGQTVVGVLGQTQV